MGMPQADTMKAALKHIVAIGHGLFDVKANRGPSRAHRAQYGGFVDDNVATYQVAGVELPHRFSAESSALHVLT